MKPDTGPATRQGLFRSGSDRLSAEIIGHRLVQGDLSKLGTMNMGRGQLSDLFHNSLHAYFPQLLHRLTLCHGGCHIKALLTDGTTIRPGVGLRNSVSMKAQRNLHGIITTPCHAGSAVRVFHGWVEQVIRAKPDKNNSQQQTAPQQNTCHGTNLLLAKSHRNTTGMGR